MLMKKTGAESTPILTQFLKACFEEVDTNNPADMDPDLVEHLVAPVEWIGKKYFRAEVHGIQNIPKGPALLVGNHNAGITFLEPFFFGAEYYRQRGKMEPIFFLAHDAMVDIPLLKSLLCRLGGIRASYASAQRVLDSGAKLAVYPGGNHEAFRRFSRRHTVDLANRKGFLKIALQAEVPLVPLVHIGGHETFFVLHEGSEIVKRFNLKRFLRIETFPIVLSLPWGLTIGPMFFFPLPSKSVTQVGTPIDFKAMGYGPEDAKSPEVLQKLYTLVQSQMQEMLSQLASRRKIPIIGNL